MILLQLLYDLILPDVFGPESIQDFMIVPIIESVDEFERAQINEFLFPHGDPDEFSI
jgi:hypothetical protein